MFNKPLQKAAKKAGVSFEVAKEMIAYDHALKTLYNKKDLAVIQIKFKQGTKLNDNVVKSITKVAKALHISFEAVLGTYLYDALKQQRDSE